MITEKIHINTFSTSTNRLKRIETGAELMLMIAINAYTKRLLGKRLDCSNIRVNKDLKNQELFAFACDPLLQPDGVLFHKDDKPVRVNSYVNRYAPDIVDIIDSLVLEKTDTYWRFAYTINVSQNIHIRTGTTKLNYMYLVAKWIVECYINKVYPRPKLIIDRAMYSLQRDEYSYLIILKKYGAQFLSDSELELRDARVQNCDIEWVAYCEEKRAKGMMSTVANRYSPKDKMEYLVNGLNLTVGDVVILFRRKACKNAGDVTQNLTAAYPATIANISQKALSLVYYTSTELKLTRKYHIDRLRQNGASEYYTVTDYNKFDPLGRAFDWYDIGIEGYASTETFLIIPPVRDDFTIQYINDGISDVQVQLDTIETIYALFEDRNLPYDKNRFLKKYFKGAIPIYDQFKMKREQVAAGNMQ